MDTDRPPNRRLTYPLLGDTAARLVGKPLGADGVGWPYVVRAAEFYDDHTVLVLTRAYLTVEPPRASGKKQGRHTTGSPA